jgi:hypothetical protein
MLDSQFSSDAAAARPLLRLPLLTNIHRTLVLAKRGVSPFLRHFMVDFCGLLPLPAREKKFGGDSLIVLNDIADSRGCDHVALFQTCGADSLLWLSSCPGGPTLCFRICNMHGIAELHLLGRCCGRPILLFDPAFDARPEFALAKEMFRRCFSATGAAFVDTAITFCIVDSRIWISRYQIEWDQDARKLVEAGPRCCLELGVVLGGSFCGVRLYKNAAFAVHAVAERKKAKRAKQKA